MTDETTNESNDKGKEVDTPKEESDTSTDNDKKPISLYDKTEAIVTRQEEANKKREELLDREEKLFANQRLAGTTGGNVAAKAVSPDNQKTYEAEEFFKDEALGDARRKTKE